MIDYKFLEKVEGFETYGYTLDDNNSGITIASGVDLAYQTPKGLLEMGVPVSIVRALIPFMGVKGGRAEEVLSENGPLVLSEEEARILNEKVKGFYASSIRDVYNDDSFLSFMDLPIEMRTVIVSVLFQYGYSKPDRVVPNFWRQVTTGQWKEALANLRDFGDDYPTRRNKEADLLEAGIYKLEGNT